MQLATTLGTIAGVEELWVDCDWYRGEIPGSLALPLATSVNSLLYPNRTLAPLFGAHERLAVDCPRSVVDSHIAVVAVAAHAHELNLATILWFGPEQTNNNTCEAPPPVFETCDAAPKLRDKAWLLQEHPEWLIDASLVDNRCPPTGPPCGTDKLLFDLSLPDAAAWLTDFLRQAISTWGIGEPQRFGFG